MAKILVHDALALLQLLKQKYGTQLISSDELNNNIEIRFSINNNPIIIIYKDNEYLQLSMAPKDQDLYHELITIIEVLMGDMEAICKYRFKIGEQKDNNDWLVTEWSIAEPKERLQSIMDECYTNANSSIYDLTLANKLYYKSPSARYLFGIYPGDIDEKCAQNMTEVDLWLAISNLTERIKRRRSNCLPDQVNVDKYSLFYLIYQTTRFGVELEEPSLNPRLTSSYYAWFEFYKKHFTQNLNDAEWNAFQRIRNINGDISSFLPKKNWRDSMNTAKAKQKINKKTN